MKVKFNINTKPIPKGRPRLGKGGKVYTPNSTKVFEEICRLSYGNRYYFDKEYISIKIVFKFKVPKSYSKKKYSEAIEGKIRPSTNDIDNLSKSVFDGLNGKAWKDDRYIYRIEAEKIFADKDCIEVEIESI